ncbi:hypothetical protein BJV82DRAFT_187160 [Fennellomyces sp. T-0311]|nr:hypothetical protein BJV82DRAFT_187160 [Fennellomyces sp. T-0311]
MSDFITFLPSETIRCIISHLSQLDCVECMRVSRLWFDRVPSYATALWVRLEVSSQSWETFNQSMLQCLTPHVQTVLIREMSTVKILVKLREMNCPIRSLEIENHAAYIAQDEYSYTLSNDAGDLLEAINLFDSTLNEISIMGQQGYISVHDILLRFPKLTHLTLLYDGWKPKFLPEQSTNTDTSVLGLNLTFPNITYLNLDNAIADEQGIRSILRHCPELTSLVISTDFWFTEDSVSFDILFTTCPNIRHLIWRVGKNPSYYAPLFDKWKKQTAKLNNYPKGAVRELVFIDYMHQVPHLEPILEQSDQLLEFMHIEVISSVHWNFLTRLSFPCLKNLHIDSVNMTGDEWQTFIRRCPHVETISLYLLMEIPIMSQIIEALGSLEHLQHLEMRNNLEDIHLPVDLQPTPWHLLSKRSNLRSLELSRVCFSRDSLLSLCKIPSLLELVLDMQHHDECCTAEAILEFTNALSTENAKLSKLTLIALSNLTDAALENLAPIDSLLHLMVAFNGFITNNGVNAFLNGCDKKSDTVREVHIASCISVSDGFWYSNKM